MTKFEQILAQAFRRSEVLTLAIKQTSAGKIDMKLSEGDTISNTGIIGVSLRVEASDTNTSPATTRAGVPLITRSMSTRGHIVFMDKDDKKVHSLPLEKLLPLDGRIYIPLQLEGSIATSKTEVIFTDNLGLTGTRAVELSFFYE